MNDLEPNSAISFSGVPESNLLKKLHASGLQSAPTPLSPPINTVTHTFAYTHTRLNAYTLPEKKQINGCLGEEETLNLF